MHFVKQGDVVWGSGINGKIKPDPKILLGIDVRSTRGPLTASILEANGIPTPKLYGDPGLLLPDLFPVVKHWSKEKKTKTLLVPNLHDLKDWHGQPNAKLLNPTDQFWTCIKTIAQSELVIASSLHALIVADALGIPTVPVRSTSEPEFKYRDYYEGTKRTLPPMMNTIDDAIAYPPPSSPLQFDTKHILEAFPFDLWHRLN